MGIYGASMRSSVFFKPIAARLITRAPHDTLICVTSWVLRLLIEWGAGLLRQAMRDDVQGLCLTGACALCHVVEWFARHSALQKPAEYVNERYLAATGRTACVTAAGHGVFAAAAHAAVRAGLHLGLGAVRQAECLAAGLRPVGVHGEGGGGAGLL